jgi:LacI family transcriptional regulator
MTDHEEATMAAPRRSAGAPTMREVASLAQVSPMTVSRVLRQSPGVSQKNRERVESAIKKLGYRRNELARSLRQGQSTGTVGLIVTHLGNPFYARLALGIESVLSKVGIRVMLTNNDGDAERERDAVGDFSARRVAGLILVPAGANQAYLTDELSAGTPVVVVARPPVGLDADCVLVDDFGGAYAATQRLLAAGHRRIGFLGNPPAVYTGSERYRGFCAALEEAGLSPRDEYVKRAQQDIPPAEQAAAELLALPEAPTAIFATNNRNTLGAYRAIRRHRANITLAGFDDFELADMLSVPIIVVAYDPDELGRRAATLLSQRMTESGSEQAPPARRSVIPTSIVQHPGDIPPAQSPSPCTE